MSNSRTLLIKQIDFIAGKLDHQQQQVIDHKNYFKRNLNNTINFKVVLLVISMPILIFCAHRKNKGRWFKMVMDEIASVTTITLMNYFRKQLFTLFNNNKIN
ncbi:MAG: hypothetical protein PSV35_04165 [bacterium]|nr:hypothetical protein [bacterium]